MFKINHQLEWGQVDVLVVQWYCGRLTNESLGFEPRDLVLKPSVFMGLPNIWWYLVEGGTRARLNTRRKNNYRYRYMAILE